MKFTITSMMQKGEFKNRYFDILRHNVEWEKSYNEEKDALVLELESIEQLFNLFKGLEMQMGYGGHITIDLDKRIIYILDSWIE